MNSAVGPLSTAPPTMGETARTGAGASMSASQRPGSSRIGPIEITGFDGPMMIARALAIASSTSALGLASSIPISRTPSTGPFPCSEIRNCCSPCQLPRACTWVWTVWLLIGSTRALMPIALVSSAIARVGELPRSSRRLRSAHQAMSRSPRLNQTLLPWRRRASIA